MIKFLSWVLAGALVGIGCILGITTLWVSGVKEIVRGAEASPVSGSDIGWGLVKSLFLGDIVIGAGILAAVVVVWATIVAEKKEI